MIPVAVDYAHAFAGSDHEAWQQEYDAHIEPESIVATHFGLEDADLDFHQWAETDLDDLDE